MQEKMIGEDLLSLRLGLGTSHPPGCCSDIDDGTKKRKRRDHDRDHHQPPSGRDAVTGEYHRKLLGLLRTRDEMLRRNCVEEEDGKGLRLIHMLLLSATAVDRDDIGSAVDMLRELYQNVSLNGDPIQRVTAYFADGLAARLVTRRSPLYTTIMAEPSPEEQFSAFTELYRASPYYQFAHFTANQVIIEAFEEEELSNGRSLHVIDFDVSYGFQWPSLIQSLSDKACTDCNPISLRITGCGRSTEELHETELRLTNFANGCPNIVFEFEGLMRDSRPPTTDTIKIKKNSTLVVNSVFYLQTLKRSSEIADTLQRIWWLNPSAVVLVQNEGGRGGDGHPRRFLSRFVESLHYFAAMFDSLDDCLPADSAERLSIEKNHLGREIKSAMADKLEEVDHEKMETWKGRMWNSGFVGMKLSSRTVSQAKLLLKIKSHASSMEHGNNGGGFKVLEIEEEGTTISLGWQDRHLVTASAWRCRRR